MRSAFETTPISPKLLWTGRILSGLPVLFLLMDGVMKLVRPAPVVAATVKLGYPESVILGLGIVLLTATILYVIPITSVLGAILLTGYLGGAVATHVRVSGGWFPILFPVFFGVLLWGGIRLRDRQLHTLIPLTTQPVSTSKKMLWAGYILSALPALMLLFSAVMKLMNPAPVLQEFGRLGYQENVILGLGILELACTVIYLLPPTAVLGAILLTGYLGGATATHLRVGDPLINYLTIVFGVLVWGGLYLRDERLRALIPLRH